jgi:hypothetical protein
MRKTTLIIFLFVLLLSGVAHAGFINIISQEYKISGYVDYAYGDISDDGTIQGYHEDYSDTSSLPVSGGVFLPINPQGATADAYSQASGGVTSEYAWLYAYKYSFSSGGPDYLAFAFADAYASMTFSPLVSNMLVEIDNNSSFGWVGLYDLTSGQLIANQPDKAMSTFLISFDLSHIYEAVAGTNSYLGDDNSTEEYFKIAPVPEPATMLLLGLGLIGLAGIRRKIQK